MKVKFYPQTSASIQVSKCNHRFGAAMTFTFQTDTRVDTSIFAAELYGFRNNLRLGAFATNLLGYLNKGMADQEQTGLLLSDIYFCTDYWKNPINGAIEVIPDYYATAWTSAGAAVFSNAVVGQTKTAQYPTHGQAMYNASNGAYGYDSVNKIMGASNLSELTGLIEYQQQYMIGVLGKKPGAGSYRNGTVTSLQLQVPYWLGMRNSTPSPVNLNNVPDTYYGNGLGNSTSGQTAVDRVWWMSFPNSSRWYDSWNTSGNTKADSTTYEQNGIANTIINAGWWRVFTHYHNVYNDGQMPVLDEYMQIVRAAIGNNFVWSCSVGEALEYMFIRELCNRCGALEKEGKVILIADIDDKFKGTSPYGFATDTLLDRMNIPLSVEVDLTNTGLVGKNIVSSTGKVRSLGNDKYIIELIFNQAEGFLTAVLTEETNGYYTETLPVINQEITDNVLTITTDIPTKCVLFAVSAGGNDYDSVPVQRSNSYKTVHVFNISAGYDYRVGAISEFLQSSLLEL